MKMAYEPRRVTLALNQQAQGCRRSPLWPPSHVIGVAIGQRLLKALWIRAETISRSITLSVYNLTQMKKGLTKVSLFDIGGNQAVIRQ